MHSDTRSPAAAKRQRRAGRIRRSAVGSALATFAVVWAVIFFQLISGHDPALSTSNTPTAAAAQQTTTSKSATEPETESDEGSVPDVTATAPPTATAPSTSSAPLGSVTTRQS